jgi:hypothetical protein
VALETSSPKSRRAILAAAGGGQAALAAGALAGASNVRAADGDVIHVGDDLTGTTVTRISITGGASAIYGNAADGGTGVEGDSVAGFGVFGLSSSGPGVAGQSSTGPAIRGGSDPASASKGPPAPG